MPCLNDTGNEMCSLAERRTRKTTNLPFLLSQIALSVYLEVNQALQCSFESNSRLIGVIDRKDKAPGITKRLRTMTREIYTCALTASKENPC